MRRTLPWLAALAALVLLPAPGEAEEVATSAKACVVIDQQSGRVLLSHQADEPLPMASTTKVMTALLALETCSPDEMVTAGRNAFGVPGTSIYLAEGEQLTMEQMLYGLMLASGNDAAVAIAEHVSGNVSDFCALMTRRAGELGCRNTVFLTPHGLPCEGHYTTARDLALITREAMEHALFRRIVSTTRAQIPWQGRSYPRVLNNKNRLLTACEGATGVKTGYTRKAGRCLVFSAEREGFGVIGVVLGCSDWFEEAERLIDLCYDRCDAVSLLPVGESVRTLPVEGSDGQTVRAVLGGELTAVLPAGAMPQLVIDLPDALAAPVAQGQQVGVAQLWWQGEQAASSPLLADAAVPRATWLSRMGCVWNEWLIR